MALAHRSDAPYPVDRNRTSIPGPMPAWWLNPSVFSNRLDGVLKVAIRP